MRLRRAPVEDRRSTGPDVEAGCQAVVRRCPFFLDAYKRWREMALWFVVREGHDPLAASA